MSESRRSDAAAPAWRAGLALFCRWCATVGVVVLLVNALVTVADVVSRRTVGLSLPGLIDLSQLLVMTSVFLCIPHVFERRANIEVDLVFQWLPALVRQQLGRIWALAAAAFLLTAAWHVGRAAGQVLEYGERSPTLAVPMIWYWLPILFGCLLASAVCLAQVFARSSSQESRETGIQ